MTEPLDGRGAYLKDVLRYNDCVTPNLILFILKVMFLKVERYIQVLLLVILHKVWAKSFPVQTCIHSIRIHTHSFWAGVFWRVLDLAYLLYYLLLEYSTCWYNDV